MSQPAAATDRDGARRGSPIAPARPPTSSTDRGAVDGVGVVWTLEHYAAPLIAARKLVRVLEDWCQPFPGSFLYYPSRRQQPPALTALIETLRLTR